MAAFIAAENTADAQFLKNLLNGAHDLVAWKHLLYYRFLPGLWRNLK